MAVVAVVAMVVAVVAAVAPPVAVAAVAPVGPHRREVSVGRAPGAVGEGRCAESNHEDTRRNGGDQFAHAQPPSFGAVAEGSGPREAFVSAVTAGVADPQ